MSRLKHLSNNQIYTIASAKHMLNTLDCIYSSYFFYDSLLKVSEIPLSNVCINKPLFYSQVVKYISKLISSRFYPHTNLFMLISYVILQSVCICDA